MCRLINRWRMRTICYRFPLRHTRESALTLSSVFALFSVRVEIIVPCLSTVMNQIIGHKGVLYSLSFVLHLLTSPC